MTVWVVRGGRDREREGEALDNGFLTIGFGLLGDLSGVSGQGNPGQKSAWRPLAGADRPSLCLGGIQVHQARKCPVSAILVEGVADLE